MRFNLDERLINDGKALLKDLDQHGFGADAAFWFLAPDLEAWKLMISTPQTATKGPKKTYQEIQKSLTRIKAEVQSLRLDDVALLKPKTPLLKLLRVALRTGPGISGIRFTDNVINGQLIPDAYIYRIT